MILKIYKYKIIVLNQGWTGQGFFLRGRAGLGKGQNLRGGAEQGKT